MNRGDFPVQAECDPHKPDEFAAWALVALPHMNGAALPMSSEYMQLVSEHLWRCGFRWKKRWQLIKWRAPAAGNKHWLTNPGDWVGVDEPEPENKDHTPDMLQVLRAMKTADEGDFYKAIELLGKDKK